MGLLLAGFGLAVITAIPAGILMGFSADLRRMLDPLAQLYRPLPPVAYYTLFIVRLGIGEASKIALLCSAAAPHLLLNAMASGARLARGKSRFQYRKTATSRGVAPPGPAPN